MDEIEQKAASLTLDEVRQQMRDVIIEQHQGKWIYGGPDGDKEAEEKHNDFVRSRINWGIALTARERRIQVEGKKPKGGGKGSKSSPIAAAFTDDLLA